MSQKMHEDILWRVFLENTQMHVSKRLSTARHTSQVCKQWRAIMLHSSSIWGRLIDLYALWDNSEDWMREVMSRAGQDVLLWITGPISAYKRHTPDFVLSFITENWTRIQRFNVSDNVRGDSNPNRKQYWTDLLGRPAPNLEEFVFHYRARNRHPDMPSNREPWILPSPLFYKCAPMLKRFEAHRCSLETVHYPRKFTMDMPLSWFSKLHSLHLRQCLTLDELLDTLKLVPLLESLHVYESFFSANIGLPESNRVSLSRLATIRLEHWDISDAALFLDCISPLIGCSLIVKSLPYRPHQSSISDDRFQGLMHAQAVLIQYVRTYFDTHSTTSLFLSCSNTNLGLEDRSELLGSGGRDLLSISIYLGQIMQTFIQLFLTASCFSTVSQLELNDSREKFLYPPQAFILITTLVINLQTLLFLSKQEAGVIFSSFPQLRVLKIGHGSRSYVYAGDPKYREALSVFLHMRKRLGRPIAVLDLSSIELDADLGNLEELTGLVIRWRVDAEDGCDIKEYICGSGHPEELCFRSVEDSLFGDDMEETLHCELGQRPSLFCIEGWSGQISAI